MYVVRFCGKQAGAAAAAMDERNELLTLPLPVGCVDGNG